MTTTSEPSTIDDQAVEEFAGRLFELFTGAALSCLIDIGHRIGLFKAAAEGPATSAGLARRAGLVERYVREWLGAMVTAGSSSTNRRSCPPGCLASTPPVWRAMASATRPCGAPPPSCPARPIEGPTPAAPAAAVPTTPSVPSPHREGAPGGPPGRGPARAGHRAARLRRDRSGWSPAPGWPTWPAERATHSWPSPPAIRRRRSWDVTWTPTPSPACAKAAAGGLTNVRFEQCEAAESTVDETINAVFVFNALHDQAAPDLVLERIRDALVSAACSCSTSRECRATSRTTWATRWLRSPTP